MVCVCHVWCVEYVWYVCSVYVLVWYSVFVYEGCVCVCCVCSVHGMCMECVWCVCSVYVYVWYSVAFVCEVCV